MLHSPASSQSSPAVQRRRARRSAREWPEGSPAQQRQAYLRTGQPWGLGLHLSESAQPSATCSSKVPALSSLSGVRGWSQLPHVVARLARRRARRRARGRPPAPLEASYWGMLSLFLYEV